VVYYYSKFLKASKAAISESYNKALLIMGILVCVGTAIVGCNQRPNIAALHAIGAFMAFLIGAAYCSMATWQSWTMNRNHPGTYPMWFIILRATLSVLEIISVILMFVFSSQRSGSRTMATLGNVFEWCVVIIQCIFYATFCVEFSNMESPNIDLRLKKKAKGLFYPAQTRITAHFD